MKTEYVFPVHIVDEAIDTMLKAAGSALAFYSMPSSIEIMRTTMQGIMNRALSEAHKPSAEPVALTKSDLNVIREWHNAVQDVSPKYLNTCGINDDAVFSKVIALIGSAQPPAVAAQEQPAPIPTSELPAVEGDCLPQVGSKVLIHLASPDSWVEREVVGFYAWGDHKGQDHLHRVFVRVKDTDGTLNARLLKDVIIPPSRPQTPEAFAPNKPCKSPDLCRKSGFCDDAWNCSTQSPEAGHD